MRQDEIKKLHHELGNRVYEACEAFELAEYIGAIPMNGHHLRQKISMAVQNHFKELLEKDYYDCVEHKKVWDNELKLGYEPGYTAAPGFIGMVKEALGKDGENLKRTWESLKRKGFYGRSNRKD